MAQVVLSLLVISLTLLGFSKIVDSRSRARTYAELQCRSTLYFDLCVQTILPYATKTGLPSPQKIALISLTASLAKARYTKDYINTVVKELNDTKNLADSQAMGECLRQISDGVNQIMQSVKELEQMETDDEERFVWHESNVLSWVSAALTDATTCIDGILGDEIGSRKKAMIKARFLNVKQLASNSLALFNRFTTRHRASRAIKNP